MWNKIIFVVFTFCLVEYSYTQPTKANDLCSDKPCGAVCNAIDDMSQVMKYCQPDGTCTGRSHPECQVSQDLCSDKPCGAVCGGDINPPISIFKYCQPDGRCTIHPHPDCQASQDLCAGKPCGAVC